ncbi:MAG: dUTP diphosphatase [Oscillospiraceae bacterium]
MESLKIKLLSDNAKAPYRASKYSAGYDLYACVDGDIVVPKGKTVKIGTGFAMEMPCENLVGLIYARSSMGTKFGVIPANAVGVIDYDYRGEIIVALHNNGNEDYTVKCGDRIAQLVVTPIVTPEIEIANELSETQRGDGGFGSTGKA